MVFLIELIEHGKKVTPNYALQPHAPLAVFTSRVAERGVMRPKKALRHECP